MDTLTPQQRSTAMAAVKGKNTGPELTVRKLLYGLGYHYRLHAKDLPGRPDIVLRKRQCVIFVNGCFWHGHDCPRGHVPSSNVEFWERKIGKNRERDIRVQKELRKSGWRVLVLWECELTNASKLERKLRRFLGQAAA